MDQASVRLLTVFEAEKLIGRKAVTLRRDIRLGKIASVRIGRQVRIPLDAIRELIKKGYRQAVEEN